MTPAFRSLVALVATIPVGLTTCTPADGPASDLQGQGVGSVWVVGPDLPRPVANNAVTGLEVGGGAHVYSFLGIDQSKRWDGVVSWAFRWVMGSDTWEELPPVPGPGRLAGTAEAWGGKVYLFGGYTVAEDGSEASVPNVDVFDPLTDSWARATPMPVPVDDAVSGVWQDSLIYLVSGWHDRDNVPAVQLYDPTADSWSVGRRSQGIRSSATPAKSSGTESSTWAERTLEATGPAIRSKRPHGWGTLTQ